MLTGFFSGVSGMHYNEQKLNVTSHNLANVGTTGFRGSNMMLSTRSENPFTKEMDSAVRRRHMDTYGIQRTGVFKNYEKTGNIQHTGNPLDVSIATELSNAFFAVKRSDPTDNQTYYTRNGKLSLGPSIPGDPNSPSALYASGHLLVDANGQPIEVDPARGKLTINNNGTIYQDGQEVAEIPLFRLNKYNNPANQESAELQKLQQLGQSLLAVPEHARKEFFPQRIEIGQNGVSRLMQQGSQEASNVNIFHEMMEMMNATKGHSANMSAIREQLGGLKKLFEVVRT